MPRAFSARRHVSKNLARFATPRGRQAIHSAIQPLETRLLMSTTMTYVVTGNSDTVPDIVTPAGVNLYQANTLRAAIDNANSQPFPVIIQFDSTKFPGGASNTITLTATAAHPNPTLTLGGAGNNHAWTLVGPSTHPITINGAGLYTILQDNLANPLEVDSLTFAHGNTAGSGGAITALSALTLNGDTFSGNIAVASGGAIMSANGAFSASNCVFIGNHATNGGAVAVTETVSSAAPVFTSDTFSSNTAAEGGAIFDSAAAINSTLTITNGTFTGNAAQDAGGAVYNAIVPLSGGTLGTTITGTTFTGNTAIGDGGALYDAGWWLSLAGDNFTSNKSTSDDGGAIHSTDGSLTIAASTFTGDTAFENGGAVYFAGGSDAPTLAVTSSTFSGDVATTGAGGALDIEGAKSASIANSTFSRDTALQSGGAIDNASKLAGASLAITGGTFSHNATQSNGGAVNSIGDSLTISGVTFSFNTASQGDGGAVDANVNTLAIDTTTLTKNSAFDNGGGVYFLGTTGTVTGTTFSGNSAANDDGGGMYSQAATLTVINATFTGDSATNGGALYSDDTTLVIAGGVFTSNTANAKGGALFANNSNTTVTGATFTSNSVLSSDDGGGLYCTSATLVLGTDNFNSNTAGNEGGAVAFYGGKLFISQSTFAGNAATNAGGAIASNASFVGIYDSTLSGNSSTLVGGGAFYFYGGATDIANDTFFGNATGGKAGGGALFLNGTGAENVTDSTIDANSAGYGLGGGIAIPAAATGTVTLLGDIVAQNYATGTPGTGNDVAGNSSLASTNNIIGQNTFSNFPAGSIGGNFVGTNFAAIDPLLAPLADNGGPTQTQALLGGSLAIGNNSDYPVFDQNLVDVTAVDQRGVDRPQSQGYDIGAYQSVPAGPNDHFVFVVPANANAGAPFAVVVEALTDLNIPDNSYSNTVNVTSSDASASGLPGPGTLVFSGGVASFTPTFNTAGPQTLTITDTTPGSPVAPVSSSAIAVSGPVVTTKAVVSIGNASITKPTSGTAPLSFTVSLTASAPAGGVTVHYGTLAGTASSGAGDYVGVPSGTLLIPAGATSGTINISVKGNKTVNAPRAFTVKLTSVSGAILGPSVGTGTILSSASMATAASINNVAIHPAASGLTPMIFTVMLTSPAGAAGVSINYGTLAGTASSGAGDYIGVPSATLNIAAGHTSGTITIMVKPHAGAAKHFFLKLTAAVGATIADDTGVGTIT